ncbi:sugar-binding protein [Pseudalkalibacillus caeni]|uniref:Sugar ABC transporter substrate-binding protein n=1 Tax=Exobacillus caeni TaxID=2574798 RepID=A0A5R9F3Z2_9BACL|nr:sugar-binding protein [Pseudalkalibacillus caeni]TLS38412.1 sugar ABC transporter substrate-binding protein [Pseudalkalibacillus caeni]
MGRMIVGACITLFVIAFSFFVYFSVKAFNLEATQAKESYSKPKYHLVLVPEEINNDYWRLVEKGARTAAEELGVTLEYAGPKQANLEEHINTIEMAAAAKVDGIMTQGLSEEQFTPLIDSVIKKGTPIITVDTDAPNSNRISYIGTDNYYAGLLAGKALLADTDGEMKVAIVTGRFDATHQKLRVQGFKDAVKEQERVKIVAIEASQITRIQAAEKTYKILKEHPDVNGFYGTSALDAIGISQVVESMGKNNDMYIIGFDVLPETVNLLRNRKIEATVVQKPYEMGYQAVETMVKILEGKKVSAVNHTETKVIHNKDLPLQEHEMIEGAGR